MKLSQLSDERRAIALVMLEILEAAKERLCDPANVQKGDGLGTRGQRAHDIYEEAGEVVDAEGYEAKRREGGDALVVLARDFRAAQKGTEGAREEGTVGRLVRESEELGLYEVERTREEA